jgi:hypothetical protein
MRLVFERCGRLKLFVSIIESKKGRETKKYFLGSQLLLLEPLHLVQKLAIWLKRMRFIDTCGDYN